MRALVLPVAGLLWGLSASAAPSPALNDARKLIDDLELEAAVKALDAVDKTEGNDRQTLLELFTLQGIAFGTLGKEAKTRDAFRRLLVLDPGAKLPPDLPPRVRTPFFEAKDWSSTNGPLTAVPRAQLEASQVRSVSVTIDKDSLRLARSIRFHLEGAEPADVPLTGGSAQVSVGRLTVSWWAEVLTDRKGVLLEVGNAAQPRVEGEVAAEAVKPAAPQAGSWRRPTGVVLLGAGVVAASVGVFLGLQANEARATVAAAARDELGRITSLTQRDAVALETTSRANATTANVLFGVGGALAAAGVVLIILGPADEPTVALSPMPGGVVFTGAF